MLDTPRTTHRYMPIVVSFSDFANFKRCRRLFAYTWQMGLSPKGDTREVMQFGTDVHKYLERIGKGEAPLKVFGPKGEADSAAHVAAEYLKHHPLPKTMIGAEVSIYTLVVEETAVSPALYIRTTLDAIYTEGRNGIVGRDYKTFASAPSFDVDLDFQGRIYDVILWRRFPNNDVSFEWEYIRQQVGRTLKGQGYVEWPIDERYLNIPMVTSDIERATTWRELQETAADLVRAVQEQRLYRIDLKAGPHSCDNCHHKGICKAEYSHGTLSPMDIELFAKHTDPAERASALSILNDPRVQFYVDALTPFTTDKKGNDIWEEATRRVYGNGGVALMKEHHAHG